MCQAVSRNQEPGLKARECQATRIITCVCTECKESNHFGWLWVLHAPPSLYFSDSSLYFICKVSHSVILAWLVRYCQCHPLHMNMLVCCSENPGLTEKFVLPPTLTTYLLHCTRVSVRLISICSLCYMHKITKMLKKK